jgi:hypothetical protein
MGGFSGDLVQETAIYALFRGIKRQKERRKGKFSQPF